MQNLKRESPQLDTKEEPDFEEGMTGYEIGHFSLTPVEDLLRALPPSCDTCKPRHESRARTIGGFLCVRRLSLEQGVAVFMENPGCTH